MTTQLQKKVERAIKLIQMSAPKDGSPVEVAYSGGKDSDVILQLTKESGIAYRAIYKNTTIDPPGTIKHAREAGAEILQPKKNFFQLIAENGLPTRFSRFCCRFLKEYKVMDKAIIGVRKAESVKRAKRYSEPTECKFYGNKKKDHVEAIYPILDWTDQDVVDFINDRGIKLHSLYYTEDGKIDPKRRLGCIGCPLASKRKRIEQFKQHPNMVKAYLRNVKRYMEGHENAKRAKEHKDEYSMFVRDVFFADDKENWEKIVNSLFELPDFKQFLEDYFKIKL